MIGMASTESAGMAAQDLHAGKEGGDIQTVTEKATAPRAIEVEVEVARHILEALRTTSSYSRAFR
jgi:hypothetical protein